MTFTSGISWCNLVKGRCYVTMAAITAGKVVIIATYNGDGNNTVSFKTRNLTIK